MKKYLLSLISFGIAIVCIVAYSIMGISISTNGTISEPFFLLPLSYLFALVGLISTIVVQAKRLSCKHKKEKK